MSDLSLENTDDLLAEVFNRYDDAVFCGQKRNIDGAGLNQFKRRWKGNHFGAIGAAEIVKNQIVAEYEDDMEDPPLEG